MIYETNRTKWSQALLDMVAANINFAFQLNEWQLERHENKEDPYDWHAFRVHLKAIGAPDPCCAPEYYCDPIPPCEGPPEFYVKIKTPFNWLLPLAAGGAFLFAMIVRKKR